MDSQYKWMTIEEVCMEILSDKFDDGGAITFTLDDYESNCDDPCFEPEGWYGIARTVLFDEPVIIFGYYGGGMEAFETLDGEDDLPNTIYSFISYYQYACQCLCDDITPTKDTLICVDTNYPYEF